MLTGAPAGLVKTCTIVITDKWQIISSTNHNTTNLDWKEKASVVHVNSKTYFFTTKRGMFWLWGYSYCTHWAITIDYKMNEQVSVTSLVCLRWSFEGHCWLGPYLKCSRLWAYTLTVIRNFPVNQLNSASEGVNLYSQDPLNCWVRNMNLLGFWFFQSQLKVDTWQTAVVSTSAFAHNFRPEVATWPWQHWRILQELIQVIALHAEGLHKVLKVSQHLRTWVSVKHWRNIYFHMALKW